MRSLTVAPQVASRLSAFMRSDLFTVQHGYAKSDYWQHFADQLSVSIGEGVIDVAGVSGFYVPPSSSALRRAIRKVGLGVRNPGKAVARLTASVRGRFSTPRLLSYARAFDAVMSHADVSGPELSKFRIDHLALAKRAKVFTDANGLSSHYRSWSGYALSDSIIHQYYHQNILRGFVAENDIHTVMEIGAGNGNLPSIFFHDWAPIRVILVDLPETLAIAIPFLSSLFPQAKLLLPHELSNGSLAGGFDFAFLTVDQLDLIADDSVDLSINCDSFGEMTYEQIGIYFKLLQRVTRDGGVFFTSNRVEKILTGSATEAGEHRDPPNRFAEYPWSPKNEILAYEISRLIRLVQLDGAFVRVERIRK